MKRRPPHIPQKRLIYVGCEGASEAGYAALLQDLADRAGLPIHLKIDDLGRGAGDPLARVQMAVRRIEEHSAKRIAPEASYLFLDTDQLALDRQRAEEAQRLADRNGISIVWQEPCFEAMLLRHMPGRANRRPPDTAAASDALRREWPEYEKGTPRLSLSRRIDLAAVLRAAEEEAGLAGFLRFVGLME
ncbi:hypothetical protein BSFA1_83950 (plasmid) [Burkholderia sp. SFA1]|nr:hypothetical protein BYI23_F000110 [Burkholderia sp. YI23]BBQ03267.1 hypothetical protein BSFA1_83950 [Burkholderia sp. SFA1]